VNEIVEYVFGRAFREISCKNIKSTRGAHFTILPASPCAAELYEIWHTRSTHQRNYMCQIFSQSVQELGVLIPQNFPLPLTCCVTLTTVYALPCDTVIKCSYLKIFEHLFLSYLILMYFNKM